MLSKMPYFSRLLTIHNSMLNRFRRYKDILLQPVVFLFSLCRIHPLALTLTGFIFGLISLRALFENYHWFVLFMSVSVLLDGLDGALARRIHYREPLGEYMDYFVDTLLMVCMFIALVCWLKAYVWLYGLVLFLLVWIFGWQYYGSCKVYTCRVTLFLPAMIGWPRLGLFLVPLYACVVLLQCWLLRRRMAAG